VRAVAGRALAAVATVAFAVLAAGFAGREAATRPTDITRPTYFQDVKPILDARCAGCHYRGGVAPFALETYAQARFHSRGIGTAVAQRLMPPWHAERGIRAYRDDPTLTGRQIDLIRRWVAAGTPKGDPKRRGAPIARVTPRLSRVDLRLAPSGSYAPKRRPGGDDYRCFALEWPAGSFVTGFNVKPGARRQVHHIIVYVATPAEAARVDAWEAADPAPGYGCYGGPSATGARQIAARFLAGWVPGSFGTDFPTGTGIRVDTGSRLVLQVHYNLDHVPAPRPDRSIVELKLDSTVARRGLYVPIVDVNWLISRQSFTIPAGEKRIVHSTAFDPRFARAFVGDLDVSRGFLVHSALHHMHRLGERGRIAIERAGGGRDVLLSIRRWDFNWQREYFFAKPAVFEPGDKLSIRCEHDNSRANQPLVRGKRQKPRTLTWGEDSSDEMCIGFLYVSER
jgi:hypothetical protein